MTLSAQSTFTLVLHALAWSLLHAAWQGVVISAVHGVLRAAVGRSRPDVRYGLACGALGAVFLAWVATFVACLARAAAAPTGGTVGAASPSSPALAILLGAWTVGVAILSLRMAGGLWHLTLMSRDARAVDERWERLFERLKEAAAVQRAVRLAESARVGAPVVVGWLRPVVLVPPALLAGLPVQYVEAVLLHELAHVRRHDWLVNVGQSVIETLLFHLPTTWWLSSRIRAEREHCCDVAAANVLGDRQVVARALARLEESRAAAPVLAPSSHGGSLVKRIELLVSPSAPSRPAASPRWLAPAIVVAFLSSFWALGAWASSRHQDDAERGRWLPPAVERWRPHLERAGERHGVDPDLLAVVVLVESGGDPGAVSSRGATGLMQVMPATAAHVAEERGITDHAPARLSDAEYNVDLGAWYLARQLESFGAGEDSGQAVERAVAAYNGGPGRVRSWLRGEVDLTDETTRYKQLVTGLWRELDDPSSFTFEAWRARVRSHVAAQARHPLPGARESQGYGNRPDPFRSGQRRFHRGVDLVAPLGTPALAPLSGTVLSAGTDGDHGRVVVLGHAGGFETRFHHLERIDVEVGDRLAPGEAVGTVGSTGRSTGPHLHFEVRELGEPVDPAPFLAGGTMR